MIHLRRQLLVLVLLVAPSAGAFGQSIEYGIGEIRVTNDRSESITVEVSVKTANGWKGVLAKYASTLAVEVAPTKFAEFVVFALSARCVSIKVTTVGGVELPVAPACFPPPLIASSDPVATEFCPGIVPDDPTMRILGLLPAGARDPLVLTGNPRHFWRLAGQPAVRVEDGFIQFPNGTTLGDVRLFEGAADDQREPGRPFTGEAAVHPGVVVEFGRQAAPGGRRAINGDARAMRLGAAVVAAGDVNGDGFGDVLVGAPGAAQARLVSGRDGGELVRFRGADGEDELGAALAAGRDLDGDGVPDVILGAPGAGGAGLVAAHAADGRRIWSRAGDPGDRLGHAVAFVGDLDGDGVADVLVGAPGRDTVDGADFGQALLLSGRDGRLLHAIDGPHAGSGFGYAVASLGDATGDGVGDFAVGAPTARADDGPHAGIAVAYGGAGFIPLRVLRGVEAEERFGHALAGLDGGVLVVGALGARRGRGRVVVESVVTKAEGLTLSGYEDGEEFGAAVAAAGDVDRDGRFDLAVGSPGLRTERGRVGGVHVFDRRGQRLRFVAGSLPDEDFGRAVAGAGDFNADGFADVIAGGPGHDGSDEDAGRAVVLSVAGAQPFGAPSGPQLLALTYDPTVGRLGSVGIDLPRGGGPALVFRGKCRRTDWGGLDFWVDFGPDLAILPGVGPRIQIPVDRSLSGKTEILQALVFGAEGQLMATNPIAFTHP